MFKQDKTRNIEVELSEDIEFICGKMDWAKTEKIKIQDLSEGDCIEMADIKFS